MSVLNDNYGARPLKHTDLKNTNLSPEEFYENEVIFDPWRGYSFPGGRWKKDHQWNWYCTEDEGQDLFRGNKWDENNNKWKAF